MWGTTVPLAVRIAYGSITGVYVVNMLHHMEGLHPKAFHLQLLRSEISRASDQNRVSSLYIMLEIHHSGGETLFIFLKMVSCFSP